jgi:hypothetical protein
MTMLTGQLMPRAMDQAMLSFIFLWQPLREPHTVHCERPSIQIRLAPAEGPAG